MRWGVTVFTIALLIALVWVSGCADVSFGNQKIGDFGPSPEENSAVNYFIGKYGDPRTNSGPSRFLEPMVTTGLVNNTPVNKVTKFSKDTGSIFFWVFYDNFKKGDPLTLTWTFNGKTVITLQREAGGDFGRAFGEFLKPDKGWAVGTHTITISGGGTSATTTFEIVDGQTQTVALPYQQASAASPLTKTVPVQQLKDTSGNLDWGTIVIVAPTSGQVVTYGSTVHIEWNPVFDSYATTRPVNIEMIHDGGAVLYLVQTANTGSYDWDLSKTLWQQVPPDQLSGTKLVYLRISTPDQKYFGRTDLFTIYGSQPDIKGGKITITSPKSGDKVQWGLPVKIIWDPRFATEKTYPSVTVDVLPENGKRELLSVQCANTGLCEFELPDDTSPPSGINRVYFKIYTVTAPYEGSTGLISIEESPLHNMPQLAMDYHDLQSAAGNVPEVAKSPIKIIRPTGADVITLGDTFEIQWDPDFPREPAYEDKIPITFIKLYSETGEEITYLASFIENTGRYTWVTLPSIDVNDPNFEMNLYWYKTLIEHPGRCYITVEAFDHIGKSEVFTLKNPSYIAVTSPNKDTILRWGDPVPITWDPPKLNDWTTIDKVSISVLISGGKLVVISDAVRNTGSYTWESASYQPVLGAAPKNVVLIITTPDGKRIGISDQFSVQPPTPLYDLKLRTVTFERYDNHGYVSDKWKVNPCPPETCWDYSLYRIETSQLINKIQIGYTDRDISGHGDLHKRWRGLIVFNPPTQPVKKATLRMHLGHAYHDTEETAMNDATLLIGSIWILNGRFDYSFGDMSSNAQGYIGAGVNEDKWSFDRDSKILTIDITDPVNQWVAGRANYGMVFIANDEGMQDRVETYTNTFDLISATYEPA